MQVKLPERGIKCLFYGFMTYVERIFAKILYPDPDNPEITNLKFFITETRTLTRLRWNISYLQYVARKNTLSTQGIFGQQALF